MSPITISHAFERNDDEIRLSGIEIVSITILTFLERLINILQSKQVFEQVYVFVSMQVWT